MSNDYFEVEVRAGAANVAKMWLATVLIVGVILFALSLIIGESSLAAASVIVLMVGILIYGVIILIGSIESNEAKFIAKMISIILPVSLGFTFGLIWILSG